MYPSDLRAAASFLSTPGSLSTASCPARDSPSFTRASLTISATLPGVLSAAFAAATPRSASTLSTSARNSRRTCGTPLIRDTYSGSDALISADVTPPRKPSRSDAAPTPPAEDRYQTSHAWSATPRRPTGSPSPPDFIDLRAAAKSRSTPGSLSTASCPARDSPSRTRVNSATRATATGSLPAAAAT
ncbi:MAG: hypothetical protein ACRDNZ_12350 [Streptosporangiaceae bacterium]